MKDKFVYFANLVSAIIVYLLGMAPTVLFCIFPHVSFEGIPVWTSVVLVLPNIAVFYLNATGIAWLLLGDDFFSDSYSDMDDYGNPGGY